MKKVNVKKTDLLDILVKNRTEHRDIFLKAMEKFRELYAKELTKQLKAAQSGGPLNVRRFYALVEPKDYTSEYDRVIKMLEMSVDDSVEIGADEFQNFVQDIWSWSREWAISNSGYTRSAKFDGLLDA
jgi:hypothetical protein